MLFGHGQVSERVHLVATALVAFGTTLSAFWILALNSWMQTPAGYPVDADGVYHAADWIAVIFNPSFPYRLTHMLLASVLTVAFLLAGLSAWQLLRGVAARSAPRVLRLAPDARRGRRAAADRRRRPARPQHARAPAAEDRGDGRRLGDRERGAALRLFAWPDEASRSNRFEVAVPGLRQPDPHPLGRRRGQGPRTSSRPPSAGGARVLRLPASMVGIGVLMLATAWIGGLLYWRAGWDPARLPRRLLGALRGDDLRRLGRDAVAAGTSPRSAASPSSSTAWSAPPTSSPTVPAPMHRPDADALRRRSTWRCSSPTSRCSSTWPRSPRRCSRPRPRQRKPPAARHRHLARRRPDEHEEPADERAQLRRRPAGRSSWP